VLNLASFHTFSQQHVPPPPPGQTIQSPLLGESSGIVKGTEGVYDGPLFGHTQAQTGHRFCYGESFFMQTPILSSFHGKSQPFFISPL